MRRHVGSDRSSSGSLAARTSDVESAFGGIVRSFHRLRPPTREPLHSASLILIVNVRGRSMVLITAP